MKELNENFLSVTKRSIDDPFPLKYVIFLIKFIRLLLSKKLLNTAVLDSFSKSPIIR